MNDRLFYICYKTDNKSWKISIFEINDRKLIDNKQETNFAATSYNIQDYMSF
jgi:hypothetical protein